jgi:hypothetical protein
MSGWAVRMSTRTPSPVRSISTADTPAARSSHVSPALLIGTGVSLACLGGQLQVHMGIEVHPQDHRRPARIVPGDDLAAGDRVLLASLGHPGADLVLECAVVSHAMSLAAMLPRALIAWLRQ